MGRRFKWKKNLNLCLSGILGAPFDKRYYLSTNPDVNADSEELNVQNVHFIYICYWCLYTRIKLKYNSPKKLGNMILYPFGKLEFNSGVENIATSWP